MPSPADRDRVRKSIVEIVSAPHAKGLVAAYFDPSRGFAGALFDGLDPAGLLSDNPIDRFSVDDIAAASLLDVRFRPMAVRELLTSEDIQTALAAVPSHVSLWDADADALESATELWALVRHIDGVGRTKASKLLARKRPELIPIIDSVIAEALHLGDETWWTLAAILADSDLRHSIDRLRPISVSEGITTLRLLDVSTWMAKSRSRAAVSVQLELGAPTSRSIPRSRIT